jgi:hypothetical protein
MEALPHPSGARAVVPWHERPYPFHPRRLPCGPADAVPRFAFTARHPHDGTIRQVGGPPDHGCNRKLPRPPAIPHAQPPHPRLVRHAPGPPRQRDLPCPRKTPQQHSHACHGQPRPAQPPARAHRSPETLHPGQRDQPEKRVEGTRRRIVQAQAPTMPRTVHTPSAEQHRQQPRDHHPGSSRQQPGPLPATRAHWRSGPSAGPARPRARYRPPPPPPRGGGPAPAPLLIHPDEHTAKPYDQGLTVAQAGPVGSIQGTCTTAR